jgi:hypothetical protein
MNMPYLNNYCLLCDEVVAPNDEQAQGMWLDEHGYRRKVHRECALRNVVGGIGHIEDHAKWCGQIHDPDGGRTYRQSAIEVDAWVRANGVPS